MKVDVDVIAARSAIALRETRGHRCNVTAVGTTTPDAPGVFVVKVGTMDDAAFFQPDMAIFLKDAMPFHHISADIPNFEELPPGF